MAETKAGMLDTADEHLTAAAEEYQQLGRMVDKALMLSAQALLAHRQGNIAKAVDKCQQSVDLQRPPYPNADAER